MKKCAFLSTDDLETFECYDDLLYQPLRARGWSVETVSWKDRQADWNGFDAVVIRSTWDYQQDHRKFLDVLNEIEHSRARLENDLALVEWNIDKRYLLDLERGGTRIVPTIWRNSFEKKELPGFFSALDTERIVIKPLISASAEHTYPIGRQEGLAEADFLEEVFKDRPFLVQPFMSSILTEGEFSLFFFGDTYSHTILKTPKKDDFRVQEEHGGILRKTEPEERLLTAARKLLRTLKPKPLYSRIDYVRTEDAGFALMELELIEPSLYFNMDPESPELFARVFDEWTK